MTVSSDTSRSDYAGNGSTSDFATGFRFLQNSDLKVILTVTSTGVEAVQVLNSDYTVVGAGLDSGGTVSMTTPPATGETLTIKRNVALTQTTDYVENDDFPAESHEQALDKLTMITQQIQEESDRSLKLTESQQSSGLTIPAPADGLFLQWDSFGNLQNVSISDLGAITITPFGQDFIDSANAGEGRTVLELGDSSTKNVGDLSTEVAPGEGSTIYAPLISPAFTGSPTAPTQTAGDSSTKIATTEYADSIARLSPDNLLHVADIRASGTAGGTFNSGAWQIHPINTTVSNTIAGASLTGSGPELPAGDYWCACWVAANQVNGTISKLEQVLPSTATIDYGSSELANSGVNMNVKSWIFVKFTIGVTTTFQLQQWCESSFATSGMGAAANVGSAPETYAEMFFWKVA
jgi:hypothetical protein